MADKPETVKLATNIPVVMTLWYVDYFHSEKAKKEGWDAQLKLTGKQGDKSIAVYVPLVCGKDLTNLGWLTKKAEKDRWGNPAFKVEGRPEIQVLRTEDGKKKQTQITPATIAGVPIALTAEDVGEFGGAVPSRPQSAPQASQKPPGTTFATLGDSYAAALKEALRAYTEVIGCAPSDEQLHAGAASIFIEANRQGVRP